LDFRHDIDAEPGTVNKIFIWLRGFFDYMVRMEKMSENPVADIPALSENNYIPFVFSPEQTDALLSAVEGQIRKNRECFFVRDLAVHTALCLMARCGLRISEPFRLRDSHWRRDEMTIYIEKTKFNKDRLIPVPKIVIPVLENFGPVQTEERTVHGGSEGDKQYWGRRTKATSSVQICKASAAFVRPTSQSPFSKHNPFAQVAKF